MLFYYGELWLLNGEFAFYILYKDELIVFNQYSKKIYKHK